MFADTLSSDTDPVISTVSAASLPAAFPLTERPPADEELLPPVVALPVLFPLTELPLAVLDLFEPVVVPEGFVLLEEERLVVDET